MEGLYIFTSGCFEESDRRQVAFIPAIYCEGEAIARNSRNEMPDFLKFPYGLLKIQINSKFKEYSHKDFLGSLMGLNIKRELMGDLILEKDTGYIPVSEKIKNVILKELVQIGNAPCKVTDVNVEVEVIPSYKYDDKIITVPSKRLDSLVSAITGLSRTKVTEPIEKGKVLVDYFEEKEKSKIVETGSLITIRGYGKFRLVSDRGETKKGKERLLIKKYI